VEITKFIPKERRGLIVVVTGYGKGKTTTAFGLAVRACGHDMRVCIIQFMKGDLYSGEWDAAAGSRFMLSSVLPCHLQPDACSLRATHVQRRLLETYVELNNGY